MHLVHLALCVGVPGENILPLEATTNLSDFLYQDLANTVLKLAIYRKLKKKKTLSRENHAVFKPIKRTDTVWIKFYCWSQLSV